MANWSHIVSIYDDKSAKSTGINLDQSRKKNINIFTTLIYYI